MIIIFEHNLLNEIIRYPDDYREQISDRNSNKWEKIISLFMEHRLDVLAQHHRCGTRGRILECLSLKIFNLLQIIFKPEPVFYHIEPNPWYEEFSKANQIKLHTNNIYNPDMFLEDGTWIEITLSENTAYQKLFRYGHQAKKLCIFWLDNDAGFHKRICQQVHFPNAEIRSIEWFNPQLIKQQEGLQIVEQLKVLKNMKGTIR